jgi:hypothetical protein
MKYILSLLCLILLATIFYQFKYYSNSYIQENIDSTVTVNDGSVSAVNKSLKSIAAYSEIIDRPLFSNDRKPPAISSSSNVTSINISELRGLTLYGVVISGNHRYAIVDSAGDKAEHMKIGHVYKGWNVSEINADSVKFESSKGQYELFISPNNSNKKNGIKKSYKNNRNANKSSDKPAVRGAIFKSVRKPVATPIKVPNNSSSNKPKQALSKEELDELGEEGSYHFDPDEDLEDEEGFEDDSEE